MSYEGWYDVVGDFDREFLYTHEFKVITYWSLPSQQDVIARQDSIIMKLSDEERLFYGLKGWLIRPVDEMTDECIGFPLDCIGDGEFSSALHRRTCAYYAFIKTESMDAAKAADELVRKMYE